ncbi:ribonuclease H-like domain-containing protein [Tanacetum coccineum]
MLPLRRSHVHALPDSNWQKDMLDEYNALFTNGMWVLVPRLANVNIVRYMWLFRHKYHAHGYLSRYKARLMAYGRSQQQGIDCDETFSPVVKAVTIRTVSSLVVSCSWLIHQLERSLYGIKQASRAWLQRFAGYVTRVYFQHCKTDSSLFVFHCGSDIAYLVLYVDDIILTASSSAFLQRVIASLHGEFSMMDLCSLNYFLRIFAQRSSVGLFLSQSTYAEEILEHAHMQKCNPCRTHVDTETKLGANGDPLVAQSLFTLP